MIEILSESTGNLLAVKASGKLTAEDYEETFIPALEKLLEEFDAIRLFFYLNEDFAGWEIAAAWDDAKFGFKHRDDFDKIALVGGPKWVTWGTNLASHLTKAKIETFNNDEFDTGLSWIKD